MQTLSAQTAPALRRLAVRQSADRRLRRAPGGMRTEQRQAVMAALTMAPHGAIMPKVWACAHGQRIGRVSDVAGVRASISAAARTGETRAMQQTDSPATVTSTTPKRVEMRPTRVAISVVVPVYNEADSVRPLYDALTPQLTSLNLVYELIYVDDGSRDGSFAQLQALHDLDPHVRVIRFRRNFGKTPALVAGFHEARGDVVFTMDADLQDDPAEIPLFLDKLAEGYDLVSGWKYPRHDPPTKTVPSFFFNRMVWATTGVKLHDINCGFKAYRREIIEEIKLYGELHRFIPI